MKIYRIKMPESLPLYAAGNTKEEALRRVERLTGPLPRGDGFGLRVTEMPPDFDPAEVTLL